MALGPPTPPHPIVHPSTPHNTHSSRRHNTLTGVSTWEMPTDNTEEAQQHAATAPSRRGLYIADATLPPGTPGRMVDWSRHTESSTGNAFWLNSSTGETVWAAISTPRAGTGSGGARVPATTAATLNGVATNPPADDDSSWEQLYDPNSRRYFHVHVDTGGVEWGPAAFKPAIKPAISEEYGDATAQRTTTPGASPEASPSQLSGGIFRAAGAAAKWKRRARLATEKRRKEKKEAMAISMPRGLVRGMTGPGGCGAGESRGGDGDKGENAHGNEGAVINNNLARGKVTMLQGQQGLGGKGGKGGKGRRKKMTVVRNFAAPAEGGSHSTCSFGGYSRVAGAVAHWKRRAKLSSSISSAGPKLARLRKPCSGEENKAEDEEEDEEEDDVFSSFSEDEVALRSSSVDVLPIQTGKGLRRDSSNKCVTTKITRRMPEDTCTDRDDDHSDHRRNGVGDGDDTSPTSTSTSTERRKGSDAVTSTDSHVVTWSVASTCTDRTRTGLNPGGVRRRRVIPPPPGSLRLKSAGRTPRFTKARGDEFGSGRSPRGEIAFVNPLRVSWRNRKVDSSTTVNPLSARSKVAGTVNPLSARSKMATTVNPLSARSKVAGMGEDATNAATTANSTSPDDDFDETTFVGEGVAPARPTFGGGGAAGGGGGDDTASPLLDSQVVKLEEKMLAHFEEMSRIWGEDPASTGARTRTRSEGDDDDEESHVEGRGEDGARKLGRGAGRRKLHVLVGEEAGTELL